MSPRNDGSAIIEARGSGMRSPSNIGRWSLWSSGIAPAWMGALAAGKRVLRSGGSWRSAILGVRAQDAMERRQKK
jgi:hypothetical protein